MRVSASILVAAFAATALGCGDSPRSRPAGARADTPGSPSSTPQDIDARRGADVGNRYESLPPGVSYLSGAVLPPNRGGAEYELAYLKTPRGDVVWFDSLARTSRPTPTRTVRAELKVPPLSSDERLFFASCSVAGKLDPRVVAIVVNEPNVTTFTRVRQAWRANIDRGEFELIPVTGITCEETGGG